MLRNNEDKNKIEKCFLSLCFSNIWYSMGQPLIITKKNIQVILFFIAVTAATSKYSDNIQVTYIYEHSLTTPIANGEGNNMMNLHLDEGTQSKCVKSLH